MSIGERKVFNKKTEVTLAQPNSASEKRGRTAMMLANSVMMCSLLMVTYASSCGYPNGTQDAIHTFNCKNVAMTVIGSRVLNQNDVEMYPIDFRAPMTVELTAINNGAVYYDNKVDVILSQYSSGWLSSTCEWKEIPTFGLLNNIDGCNYANNCPLQQGDLDLRLPLDMSKFGVIIDALLGNHAYQLSIHMKNYNPGVEQHEEIACVNAQMRIKQ